MNVPQPIVRTTRKLSFCSLEFDSVGRPRYSRHGFVLAPNTCLFSLDGALGVHFFGRQIGSTVFLHDGTLIVRGASFEQMMKWKEIEFIEVRAQ